MDSRSAVQPLENNNYLATVSRPSTGSEQDQDKKPYEFRAVETIEEFFRPQINKDDMNTSQIFNTDIEGAESFVVPGAENT